MNTVDLILESPRGRFFCGYLAHAAAGDILTMHYNKPSTPASVLAMIESVDAHAIAALPELDLLSILGFTTDMARYWQPPDGDDVLFARPEITAALRPIARAVLESLHTDWWSDPVDLENQRIVVHPWANDPMPEMVHTDHPVDFERWRSDVLQQEARFRDYYAEQPERNISGEWWSIPFAAGVSTTSRAREGIGALELLLEEDSSGGGEARVWAVRVDGTPRVYEIAAPTDWARLVDAYPLAVPESKRSDWMETTGQQANWFIPDWLAAAENYDAVHLSLTGYLTTPGIAIPLSDHPGSTVLAGWNPDATYWLSNDFLVVDGGFTSWHRNEDGWVRS